MFDPVSTMTLEVKAAGVMKAGVSALKAAPVFCLKTQRSHYCFFVISSAKLFGSFS